MKTYVWGVEVWYKKPSGWVPTMAYKLTRADGRLELKYFRKVRPHDKFRLRKYVREERRTE